MRKDGLTIHLSTDRRMIAIGLLLLAMLGLGAWRVNASANAPDANAAPPAVQQAGTPDANQNPADTTQGGNTSQAPGSGDANGVSAPNVPIQGFAEAMTAISGSSGGRLFYLTNFSVGASLPLTSCAAGYHMASLWEIYDTSNLTYNFSHPQAFNRVDSGSGPPAGWYGWIRTGVDSSVANTAGIGNCANWASVTSGESGTILRLNPVWVTSQGAIGPWEPDPWTCTGTAPVWCIEN